MTSEPTSSASWTSPPHTAHNWALVAHHLDILSCITLIFTCQELYHSLAYALPKWHFRDQLHDRSLDNLGFVADAHKDNERWLIERLFVYVRLGLRVDVRLQLLRRIRQDPRMHSTVRVFVAKGLDVSAAITHILRSDSCGDHAVCHANGNEGDNGGAYRSEGPMSSEEKPRDSSRQRTPRGPATVSWSVDVDSDVDVDWVTSRVTAIAGLTKVERLCLYVSGKISRLVVRDIQWLCIRGSSQACIHWLETSDVHTLHLTGELHQQTLPGRCLGLHTAHIDCGDTLADVPALAGVRNVHATQAPALSNLAPLCEAHTATLSVIKRRADLNMLRSVQSLTIKTARNLGGGTIDLPYAKHVDMERVCFSQPTQLHCPQATTLALRDVSPLTSVTPHPRLRCLTTTPALLRYVEAEEVRTLHVRIEAVSQGDGKALAEETANACWVVEDWRQRATGTLRVRIHTSNSAVILTNPPHIAVVARGLLRTVVGGKAHSNLPCDFMAAMSHLDNETSQATADRSKWWHHTLTPSSHLGCLHRLNLYRVSVDGCTIQGLQELELTCCSGSVTVRRVGRLGVCGARSLVLTVEDTEQVNLLQASATQISRVRRCKVHALEHCSLGQLDAVDWLELFSCSLPDTTLEGLARYDCGRLRVVNLQLPAAGLKVEVATVRERRVEKRLAALRKASQPLPRGGEVQAERNVT